MTNWHERLWSVVAALLVLSLSTVVLRGCQAQQEFDRAQAARCVAAGGAWIVSTGFMAGCFSPIEVQP